MRTPPDDHLPRAPHAALALLLAVASACESSDGGLPAGDSAVDVSTPTDTPAPTDTPSDLGPSDAQAPTDARPSIDTPGDGAVDAASPTDSTVPTDAVTLDVPTDLPAAADAPSPVDVAPVGVPEAVIGPAGGTIAIDELSLTVPSGALAADTEISVLHLPDRATGTTFLTTSYALLPAGLTFNRPVTVRITLPAPPGAGATVNWSDATDPDRLLPVATTASGNTLTASNTHFSTVAVTPGPDCGVLPCRASHPVVSIRIIPASPHLRPGGSAALTALGVYSNRTTSPLAGAVAWTSADATIASVDPSTGRLAGVAPGRTTIRATQGSLTATTTAVVFTPFQVRDRFDGEIHALAVNGTTGVLYAGGDFNDGATGAQRIAAIRPDGTADPAFVTGAGFNNTVHALAVAPDGSLYVGGNFSSYIRTPGIPVAVDVVVRLTPTGALDAAFNPPVIAGGRVRALLLDPARGLYVGGDFTTAGGARHEGLVRLTTAGALDTNFNTGTGFDGRVNALALAPDGSGDVYVGGYFTAYNGTTRTRLARLDSTGPLDMTFGSTRPAGAEPGVFFDNAVFALAPALDGSDSLYVGGEFTSYFGQPIGRGVARIRNDGTRDATFATGLGVSNSVRALLATPTGEVYVGGSFDSYRSTESRNLARALASGAIDVRFGIGTGFGIGDVPVNALVRAPGTSGDLYVGGSFTTYNGATVNRLARLSDLGGSL